MFEKAGQLVQALLLGIMLAILAIRLFGFDPEVVPFRYMGF